MPANSRERGRPPGVTPCGDQIRSLRERLGLTREDLAAAIKLSGKHVGTIERGKSVALVTLVRIATFFGVAADSLMPDKDGNCPEEGARPETEFEWIVGTIKVNVKKYGSLDEAIDRVRGMVVAHMEFGRPIRLVPGCMQFVYEARRSDWLRLIAAYQNGELRSYGVIAVWIGSPRENDRERDHHRRRAAGWRGRYLGVDLETASASIFQSDLRYRGVDLETALAIVQRSDLTPAEREEIWGRVLDTARPYIEGIGRHSRLRGADLDELTGIVIERLWTEVQTLPLPPRRLPIGRNWLVVVIRNAIIDRQRHGAWPSRSGGFRSVRTVTVAAMNEIPAREEGHLPPENAVELMQLAREFGVTLRGYQRMVWEAYLEGLAEAPPFRRDAIAATLEITSSAVASILSRVRLKFKEYIEQRGYEPPW